MPDCVPDAGGLCPYEEVVHILSKYPQINKVPSHQRSENKWKILHAHLSLKKQSFSCPRMSWMCLHCHTCCEVASVVSNSVRPHRRQPTRQEPWSGLPFPSPIPESVESEWSCSVVSDSSQPHGQQPIRLLCPWDFPGKSTEVGCHCLCLSQYSIFIFWLIALYNSPKWGGGGIMIYNKKYVLGLPPVSGIEFL